MPQVIRPPDQIADITGLQSALGARQSLTEKNVANGYVGIDQYGLISSDKIPDYNSIDGGSIV